MLGRIWRSRAMAASRAKGVQIGADIAVGYVRQALEVDILRQRHAARVDLHDLQSTRFVGDADGNFPIEPAGAPQRRIESIGNVGGTDDDDLPPCFEPVHQRKQLRHHSALDLLLAAQRRALGGNGIDLVKEDDARAGAGLLEDSPQMRFALAVELVHDLRPSETEELGVGLVGDRSGNERLATPGWAVQQDALRRLDAEPLENLWIAQGSSSISRMEPSSRWSPPISS